MRYTRSRTQQARRAASAVLSDDGRGDVREALTTRARAGGWDIVGHRWLRMARGPVSIEVWFTDVTSRVIKAKHVAADGQVTELDIIHDREFRSSLATVVTEWLDAPNPDLARTGRGKRISAAHSTEFEAIGRSHATLISRSGSDSGRNSDAPRVSTWVRTGLSPA